ncbi:MAG TPA: hypothetical protein VMQ40_03970 [Acidimicrobiales bacterium]|jgi:hypothetical protein|nr:hypothetical protein [Acidimicrobiales bacterium]
MGPPEVRLVAASQVAYVAGLVVCLAIRPRYLVSANEGGISNFGVHAVTVVPYSVGFLVSAGLLVAAARATAPQGAREARFAAILQVLAWILVVVLVSTYDYQAAAWLRDLHLAIAIAATVIQGLIALWIVARVCRVAVDLVALAALCAALALAGCALAGWLHVLLAAQLAGTVAFGVLLVRAAAGLARDSEHDAVHP